MSSIRSARIPGPRDFGARALGSALSGELLPYLSEISARYGPVTAFRLGLQRSLIVNDAALVEELLVARQHEFVRDNGAQLLRELVGDGLLTLDDPQHLQRRRTLQPAFHRARVAAYATEIVAETQRLTQAWPRGRAFDIGADMTRLTLAIVGSALFGADLRAEADRIAAILARVSRRGAALGAILAFALPGLRMLRRLQPGRASFLFPRERAELDAIVTPIIERRLRDGEARNDVLSLLLDARDDAGTPLGAASLRNELVTLVLAGHETTANALTWVWYLLAEHPAAARRLQAEIDRELGGRAPHEADVARLPYAAAVFDEALRLYPPAAAFARRPRTRVTLGGYAIAKGTSIFVSPYVTQRDPRYFEDPLAFRPERWFGAAPPRFAFFPFGGGSKMCIGEPFARLEAVLVMTEIARRFTLRRTEREPVRAATRAILRPDRPIFVEAVPRTDASS